MIKLLLTLLVLTTSLCAQQSQGPVVVPVSADDITEIRKTHDALVTAQKKWDDLQQTIGKKYLVVPKNSPDASDEEWWDDDTTAQITGGTGGTGGTTGITSVSRILSNDGNGWVTIGPSCETAEERTVRIIRESNEKAAQAKEVAEQQKLANEREAKSKRVRKGFDSPDDFIFSDDYKYLLKKPPPPPDDASHQGLSWNTRGIVDSNVTTEDVQSNSSGFTIKGNN